MIKIDGLSHRQLQKALARDRLPYLRRLVDRGRHELRYFYSGVPSATPAVQGELFYGVRSSVPSVAFIERKNRKKFVMLFPGSVGRVAEKLARQGTPLLKGGTSYSNIFTGGADEARYCIQTMRLRSIRHLASSVKLVFHFLVRPVTFFRMIGHGLLEAGIALYDCIRGATQGKSIFKELKFIPTRVLVCILLRELIRVRVKMDLAAGRRIIHASFLGYDEQAHRRGPDSAFAHWTLKGIDAAIADIGRAARRSQRRCYRLIVYSDHGQEVVISYRRRYGKTPEDAIEAVTSAVAAGRGAVAGQRDGNRVAVERSRGFLHQDTSSEERAAPSEFSEEKIQVTTMGPLGHIYLMQFMPADRKAEMAGALVKQAHIPLVLYLHNETAVAVNRRGSFDLEKNGQQVLGGDHPYPDRTAADLARVCRHPNAGDLVISGWNPDAQPLTFAVENGAHGGPGKEETSAFAILPEGVGETRAVLRPLDLRRCVFDILGAENHRQCRKNA